MIRINLLKPLASQPMLSMGEEPAGGRKKALLALAALVVVALAVAVLQYPSLLGGLLSRGETARLDETVPASGVPAAGAPAETAPEPAQPKQVTAQAVEEIVRDIRDEQGRAAPAQTYADLVPSEKIEFQYLACTRILKDIKAITPSEIGFADFIFTPPGEFYVRGLARDDRTYQDFQAGLSGLSGAAVRPGLAFPAGAKGSGKEFSFYGTVRYPLDAMPVPPDRVLSKAKLQQELRQLKQVADGLGIRLQNPRLASASPAGAYQKLVYRAVADCNYQQMEDLLTQLHEGKSNLGFLKFALHARGDELVTANLDILAYVN